MPTNKNQPQYAVIAKALINDIARDKYPVGSMLPPELDLAKQFKVSRNTMRSALRALVDMGLVSRRAGRGTQVQTRQIQPNYVQAIESLASVFPASAGTDVVVSTAKNVSADAELALLLSCPQGTPWLRFHVTRSRQGAAVSYSSLYVMPQLRAIKSKLVNNDGPFYCALEKVTGQPVVQVVHQCDAAAASAEVAKALSVAEGSPVLRKATRYADETGRVLMVADTYSAPGQQHHTVHLRLNWAQGSTND